MHLKTEQKNMFKVVIVRQEEYCSYWSKSVAFYSLQIMPTQFPLYVQWFLLLFTVVSHIDFITDIMVKTLPGLDFMQTAL